MSDKFDELAEYNPEALTADGFDDAYLGYTNTGVAVYSQAKCIEILMAGGMTEEDAEEWFTFNTLGAYVGEFTPLFLVEYEP